MRRDRYITVLLTVGIVLFFPQTFPLSFTARSGVVFWVSEPFCNRDLLYKMSSLITNILRRNRSVSSVIIPCTRTLSSAAPASAPTSTTITTQTTTSSSNHPELLAKIRGTDSSGSRKSRYLRDEGIIPGVLYGLDDERNVLKRLVSIELKTIAKELRDRKNSMENTIYRLRLDDGTSHLVTPRQLQVHPRKILNSQQSLPPRILTPFYRFLLGSSVSFSSAGYPHCCEFPQVSTR